MDKLKPRMQPSNAQPNGNPTRVSARGHVPRTAAAVTFGVLAAVLLTLGVLSMSGCQREKVVEPLKKPEEVRAAMEKEKQAKTQKPKPTRRPSREGRQARATTTPPPAAPSPTVVDTSPIVIEAASMATDKATTDPQGGKKLTRNGFLQIDNVNIPYPVAKVLLEMRGTPAGNVWPEVDLNMYNRTEKKNFFPWKRDYVTTSTFHVYQGVQNPPLPPGTYLITFRYYNDDGGSVPNEDRSVTLRRIILQP